MQNKVNNQTQNKLKNMTLLMVLLNAFTTPLMLSSANVALPILATELKLNAVLLSWVPLAYLMSSAMFVLMFGRLADMFGRKKIFLLGTFGVIATSLLAAFSASGEALIVARFLQGTSAAMLYATQVAIVSSVFPPPERGRAIGLTVSMIYLGLTCGPLLGGYLIELSNWRVVFLFHIPLAMLVILIGLWKVDEEWKAGKAGGFDLQGAFLYPLTIALFCYGVSNLPTMTAAACLLLSVTGLYLFFRVEHKTEHPLFDVSLFYSNRVFTFSCLASLIIYTATFANVVLVSLYLQYLKGMAPGMTGLIMMTQPLTMAVFSPFAGKLSDKIEPRLIATSGMMLTLIGLILLSFLNAESSILYLCISLFITGLGFSFFSSPNVNAIMSTVEKHLLGSANGAVATMRIVGQLTSIALVALVFALMIGSVEIEAANYPQLESAIRTIFVIAAVLCVPGLLFSISRGKMYKEN